MKLTKKMIGQITIVVAALILVAGWYWYGHQQSTPAEDIPVAAKYELTKMDVFALPDFDGHLISVKGVTVGMSLQQVTDLLGLPDVERPFPPDILNLEYGERLGLKEMGLVIHVRNNIVDKIVIKPPFNEFLQGRTQIGYTKAQIYNFFGKPDTVDVVPFEQNSAKAMRIYTYQKRHMQILLFEGMQNGFTLYL